MKKLNIQTIFFYFVVLFVSCSKDDNGGGKTNPKYQGEHSLLIDNIEVSGFGAIIVTGTFNIAYDPSILEIGFILKNESDNAEIKKKLNLDQLQSKEKITFSNLSDGNYSVRAYLINGNNNEIYSQSKSIFLITNSDSDYYISCLYDYINEEGKPVQSRNTNDFFSIGLISKNPIISEKVYIKLADETFEVVFSESTGWGDGLCHYYLDSYIKEDMPDGENAIEVIFQDQVSFNTGIILDKLSGKWEPLKSLYTGELQYGTKIAFQNEEYGFLVQDNTAYQVSTDFQVWRLDFSSLQWRKMSSVKLPERTYLSQIYPTQITIENKAYIILLTEFNPYDWGGDEEYFLEIWEYNMTTDVWSQKNKFSGQFPYRPIVFAHKNKFYVIGGHYFDRQNYIDFPSDNQWIYNIESNSIGESKRITPFQVTDGSYYSTFESDEYSYIISGGLDNLECKILRYSEKSNSLETVKSPYTRMSGQGIGYTFNNLIYYVGGISPYNAQQYCYTFSEDNNEWKQIADFPFMIRSGIVFKFYNKAYVGIGFGSYDAQVTMYSWEK